MNVLTNGPMFAILQAVVPPGMQGRVLLVMGSVVGAMAPLGMAIAGPVTDALGVQVWFLAGGLACALTGILGMGIPSIIQPSSWKNGLPTGCKLPPHKLKLVRGEARMALRFGIQLLQAPLLLELSRPWLERAAGAAGVDAAQLTERIADEGFDLIELNPDLPVLFPESFSLPALRRLQELKETRGVHYTVHLPLWSLDPSSPVEGIRRASVDLLADAVFRLAPLQPEVYVLHIAGPLASEFFTSPAIPEAVRGALMRRFQQQAARSLEELLRRTGLSPRSLAVETIQFPLELTLELAEAFDLAVCLDTGHVASQQPGPHPFQEALERCLPRLAEIHLHDGYYRRRPDGSMAWADHLPLGHGEVPVRELLQTLEVHGFTGPVILELSLDAAKASLAFLRQMSEAG